MRSNLGRLIVFVLTLAFLACGPVWASGTAYHPAATPPTVDPMLVTKSMKCRILEVGNEGALKIQDPKTEEVSWIRLNPETQLRAKDKKAFDGRKKLAPADLQKGQLLRITHRPYDGAVLKIKVLRQS